MSGARSPVRCGRPLERKLAQNFLQTGLAAFSGMIPTPRTVRRARHVLTVPCLSLSVLVSLCRPEHPPLLDHFLYNSD